MARTFKILKEPTIAQEFMNYFDRIEINTSEATSTVDIAVFTKTECNIPILSVSAVLNEGIIGTVLNTVEVELNTILKISSGGSIIQGSISLNDFRLKDNLIQLKVKGDNGLPKKIFADITGFVEDNTLSVTLGRTISETTEDMVLWDAVLKSSLKFNDYKQFIDEVLCKITNSGDFDRSKAKERSPFIQSEEYSLIKYATEYYMLKKFGIPNLGNYLANGNLPYFDLVSQAFEITVTDDECGKKQQDRIKNPFMVELIWSYWMEQAMLVQTMNAISLRFQNLYNLPYIKPLERFDIDPLRPLSHIIWGYIQDEQHRLSLKRRVYEYEHEYGLSLIGKAVPQYNPIDSRVKFLEVFHDLLTSCVLFFREADDTTRIPDAFPVLNNLRETHLQLASGNHNAYGNLTWTARHEMLVQQYILSRKEMKEFLGGKPMIAYNEAWMDRVETMRSIQGWGNTSIVSFYELAVHGEQILLSIRFGNWNDVAITSASAGNWARAFRDKIQRYIHAYRVVTGVDLSEEVVDSRSKEQRYIQPSVLIQQRILNNGNMQRNLVPNKSYYQ